LFRLEPKTISSETGVLYGSPLISFLFKLPKTEKEFQAKLVHPTPNPLSLFILGTQIFSLKRKKKVGFKY
jgi:hypothetical protein